MIDAEHTRAARERLLDDRAAQLARKQQVQQDNEGREHACFALGQALYALPTECVREIVPLEGYTPLPLLPPTIAGLVNVRGTILTMIDLRPLLGATAAPPVAGAQLVILEGAGGCCALLADSVRDVRRIELGLSPSIASGQQSPWVVGIADDLTLVLDGKTLLEDQRLIVDQAEA